MSSGSDLAELTSRLSRAGFVAADDEAHELIEASGGDESVLTALVERRLRGEPLAWITGRTVFCGLTIRVDPRVYVPRWQSEPLARRAAHRLSDRGTALDLCTGSGAIARYLHSVHSKARVVATELDDAAVTCSRANGVEVYRGDLFEALPRDLEGHLEVIVGVVPYVPTPSLATLPRDTFVFESSLSYDGGEDGADVLRRVIHESPRYLAPGGALLLELGGEEVDLVSEDLHHLGFVDLVVLTDDDGDVRGIETTMSIRD